MNTRGGRWTSAMCWSSVNTGTKVLHVGQVGDPLLCADTASDVTHSLTHLVPYPLQKAPVLGLMPLE